MKKLSYAQHFELILKAKKTNPYLYIKVYNEAKKQLIPEKFNQLTNQILNAA